MHAGDESAAPDTGRTFGTAVSRGATNDHAIIFRFVQQFEPGFDRVHYPDRVIVVWRYNSDAGMPADVDRVRMDEMEDLLEPHLEAGGEAVLALVSTGQNLREWTYYSKSESRFIAKLNIALQGQPEFPIEIHVGPDPNWSTYEDFRRGVKP